jgi:NADH pyrophosphatase NudC (nudix superfamily)
MGVLTEAMTGEITVDTEELVEARWFDRGKIPDMVARAASGDPDPVAAVRRCRVRGRRQICRRWATGIDSV